MSWIRATICAFQSMTLVVMLGGCSCATRYELEEMRADLAALRQISLNAAMKAEEAVITAEKAQTAAAAAEVRLQEHYNTVNSAPNRVMLK